MKVYKDINGEHRFDEAGKYLGYFNFAHHEAYGQSYSPFDTWDVWSEERERFLVDTLKFEKV